MPAPYAIYVRFRSVIQMNEDSAEPAPYRDFLPDTVLWGRNAPEKVIRPSACTQGSGPRSPSSWQEESKWFRMCFAWEGRTIRCASRS